MSDQLRKLKNEAADHQTRGRLDKALQCYVRASTLAPRDIHVRQKTAELYSRLGRTGEAVNEFQHIAGHYAAQGFFLKAIAICKVILSLDPSHTETQATLAELTSRQRPAPGAPASFQMPPAMSGVICAAPSADSDEPESEVSVLSAMDEVEIELDPEWRGDSRPETELQGLHLIRSVTFEDEAQAEEPPKRTADSSATLDPSTLPRVPLFAGLPKDASVALIERVAMIRTDVGEQVITVGEVGGAMYAVVEGEYDVVTVESTGRQYVPARIGPGSFFGEFALLALCPRLASVVCVSPGALLELDRRTFEDVCRDYPAVRAAVEEIFFSRLLDIMERTSRVFGSFSGAARRSLISRCDVVTVEADVEVLSQGQAGRGVFLVLRGQCEVTRRLDDGTSRWLATLREGEMFGEISAMLHTTCTATVRALGRLVLLHVPPDAFRELFTTYDDVLFSMDELVEQRLRKAGLTQADLL
jgi:cAMP-dependent protein kinase regulator